MHRKDYSDFELVIRSGAGQEYPVAIIDSPAIKDFGKKLFDALLTGKIRKGHGKT